ncbi:sensor domain-containing diguanylate cyclase [Aquitalea sp. ASV15]|uniref:GGDEF domain-containing protein n=1 Tax=Aquitalea sp. ASV15 TaxID=2795104 RepID=UPI001E59C573|nr:sensor domain-containing diguanylate cyclase [Aquitalea sp. ASV15]
MSLPEQGAIAGELQAALHDSPVLLALFDRHDRLRYANAAFCQAYDVAPHETLSWSELMRRNYQRCIGALIYTHDFEAWLVSARSRRGKQVYRAFEADLTDGRWIWMTEAMQPDGSMLCVATDMSELKVSERELRQARDLAQRAAQTDPLTSICNRSAIMQQFARLLARAAASGLPLAVAIIDLDHFKQINDRLGHPAGDRVIIDFVQRIQPMLRPHDGFGRLGGEEFLLLLPGYSQSEAELSLHAMLAAVAASRPLPELPGFGYSCSAGLAMWRAGDDLAQLYARADVALYQAKASGRNTLCRH